MNEIEIILLLLVLVAALTVLARRISVPYPILMTLAGLALEPRPEPGARRADD